MSQLEVDKIIPQSGTTLTIGDSGDTISFADGATLAIDTNTLAIDSTNNRVGIGTSSPTRLVDLSTSTGGTIIHMTDDATGHLVTDGVDIQQEGTLFQIVNREAGDVRFGTNNTERMRIDSSGQVGIGTTPSSWGGTFKAIDIKSYASFSADSDTAFMTANGYYNGTNWIYKNTNLATRYRQQAGNHIWDKASSGTAGNTITWSETMRIDSSGNVILNQNASGSDNNSIRIYGGETSGYSNVQFADSTDVNVGMIQYSHASNYMQFTTNDSERMRIDSSGNVLVGATSVTGIANGSSVNEGGAIVQNGGLQAQRNNDSPLYLSKASGYTYDGFARFFHNGTEVGKIGFHDNDLVIGTGDTGLKFNDAANAWVPWNTSTNSAVNGTIDIGGSTVGIKDIYTTGSIYLGGTTSANALDDYEEGLYDIVCTSGGGQTATLNTSFDKGSYVKIGRTVHAQGFIRFTGWDATPSGILRISLPFANINFSEEAERNAVPIHIANTSLNLSEWVGLISGTDSYFSVYRANTPVLATGADSATYIGSGDDVHFQITYSTSA